MKHLSIVHRLSATLAEAVPLRASQFVSFDNGISLNFKTGSTGRDKVYRIVLDGIRESPLLGYGAFHFHEKVIQPHNIILNFCLQFGLPAGQLIAGFLAWQSFRPPLTGYPPT